MTPYANITEAQAYFDDRLNTEAWDNADATHKLKALKTATRLINNLRFIGNKLTPTQINEFPRIGQSIVPSAVIAATCELAIQLLDQVDPNLEIDNIATNSEGMATVRATYGRDFVLPHIRNGIPSSEAWALLLPYLADPLSVRLIKS